MNAIVAGILSGAVTLFLGWLAKAYFLGRRLHLIQPKLFDYSGLGGNDSSKTIEVTVLNSGRRTEEDVRVQFAPGFRYTVLAANASNLHVSHEGVLVIDRIVAQQAITIILVAEGGEFRKEHILGITSKESVGTIKSTLQEAQSTPAANAVGLILLVLFLAFGYGIGKGIEWVIEENASKDPAAESLDSRAKATSIPFKTTVVRHSSTIGISPEAERTFSSCCVEVRSISRLKGKVFLAVDLSNQTKDRLSFNLTLTSPVSEQRDKLDSPLDYIEVNILVFPGFTKTINLTDYLPSEVKPQILLLETQLTSPKGTTFSDIEIQLE